MPNKNNNKTRSAVENQQCTCISCGQKTHKVVHRFLRGSAIKVPLDNETVLKGRCLVCKPLKTSNQAEEAISRLSIFESCCVWQSLSERSIDYNFVENEQSSDNARRKVHQECPSTKKNIGNYEERDDIQSAYFASTWTIASECDINSIVNDDRTVQTFGRTFDAHVSVCFDDEQSLNESSIVTSFCQKKVHDVIAMMDSLPDTDDSTASISSSSSGKTPDRHAIFMGAVEKYTDSGGAYCVNTTSNENDAFVDTIKNLKGLASPNSSKNTKTIEVDDLISSNWSCLDQDSTASRPHLVHIRHQLLREADNDSVAGKMLPNLLSPGHSPGHSPDQHNEFSDLTFTLHDDYVRYDDKPISKSCARLKTLFDSPKTSTATVSREKKKDVRCVSFSKEMVNSSPSRAAAKERVRRIIQSSKTLSDDNSSSYSGIMPLDCRENDMISRVANSTINVDETSATDHEITPGQVCDSTHRIQQTNDIEEVKFMMSSFIENAVIQEIGCNRFRDLSWALPSLMKCGCDDSKNAEVVESIVVAMMTHMSLSIVQEAGCGALWALSSNDIMAISIIVNSGVTVIVAAMEEHIYHTSIQMLALQALCNLARLRIGVDSISKHQGVRNILQSMRACDSVAIYEWSCKLLHLLATHPSNLEIISSDGGLEAIFVAMLKRKHDIRIIEDSLSILSKIASIGLDVETFSWVDMIVSVSKIHSGISCIQMLSCMILRDLAKISFDNKEYIARCGGIEVARDAIFNHQEPRVREEACTCIRLLSSSNSAYIRRLIAQSDVIDALIMAIDEHPTNDRIQYEANNAFPFICGYVDYGIEIISRS